MKFCTNCDEVAESRAELARWAEFWQCTRVLTVTSAKRQNSSTEPEEATSLTREIQHLVQSPSANALDSRLVALLSNASVMNGSSLKPSIWSMLENIHRVPPNSNPTSSPTQVENSSFQLSRKTNHHHHQMYIPTNYQTTHSRIHPVSWYTPLYSLPNPIS